MWMDDWVLHSPRESWRGNVLFRFFETLRPVVVLSSSNKAGQETYESRCAEEGIPILRRKGGGGTVLLGPGCVVLTLAFHARDVFGNQRYFHLINDLWIEALGTLGVTGLSTQGISDIAHGEAATGYRKVAGTSVFRRKHLLVYQGSLLVHPDFRAMERILAHPSREPDYREGRDHRAFLTSLSELGCPLAASDVAQACDAHFRLRAEGHFAGDVLLPPV